MIAAVHSSMQILLTLAVPGNTFQHQNKSLIRRTQHSVIGQTTRRPTMSVGDLCHFIQRAPIRGLERPSTTAFARNWIVVNHW